MEISSTHSASAHLTRTSGQPADPGLRDAPTVAAPAASDATNTSDTEGQPSFEKQEQQRQLLQQQKEIRALESRDREVRAHEQAHAAAGGAHAGSPQYQFTRGSNGVSYATGGSVSIDVSDVPGDARATLEKMQTVQRAALAPAQPSAQDRAVAAEASAKAIEARAELSRENTAAPGAEKTAATNSGEETEPSATRDESISEEISAYQSAQATQNQDDESDNGFEVYA